MNCKNCDAPVAEKFCGQCGQKADIHRITPGHLVHEFIHAITHADKGFLLLVRDLLRRPGYVTKEFLEGKRKKYFNPISFLVITTAASALVSYKSGYFVALNKPSGGTNRPEPFQHFNEITEISVNHTKLLGLILIVPLYTFLSWIFFRKPRYNYAEHFVLQSFSIGLQYIATALVAVPLFLLFPATAGLNNLALHIVYAIYMAIVYRQLFQQHIVVTTLKSVVTMLLFILLFWVMIAMYVYLKHFIFG